MGDLVFVGVKVLVGVIVELLVGVDVMVFDDDDTLGVFVFVGVVVI